MSDSAALAWIWNAKRQAINPNNVADSAIEYLTPERRAEGARLCGFGRYRLSHPHAPARRCRPGSIRPQRPSPIPAPPGSDSTGVYPQAVLSATGVAGEPDPKEAVRWLFSTFERHVLRRVDAVNAQYLPQSNLPAILFPLRDDFHLLPWADKNA